MKILDQTWISRVWLVMQIEVRKLGWLIHSINILTFYVPLDIHLTSLTHMNRCAGILHESLPDLHSPTTIWVSIAEIVGMVSGITFHPYEYSPGALIKLIRMLELCVPLQTLFCMKQWMGCKELAFWNKVLSHEIFWQLSWQLLLATVSSRESCVATDVLWRLAVITKYRSLMAIVTFGRVCAVHLDTAPLFLNCFYKLEMTLGFISSSLAMSA